MKKRYRILKATSTETLVEQVNKALDAGAYLIGSPFFYASGEPMQAVLMREPKAVTNDAAGHHVEKPAKFTDPENTLA